MAKPFNVVLLCSFSPVFETVLPNFAISTKFAKFSNFKIDRIKYIVWSISLALKLMKLSHKNCKISQKSFEIRPVGFFYN